MSERVTLYRFGDADGRGFNFVSFVDKYGDPVYNLLRQACLEIRCPQEDRLLSTGEPYRGFNDGARHYCWLSFDNLTEAARRMGEVPSMLMRDLWSMDFPVEACTFLEDQVLVDYTYEVNHE
jgi:hypothetical protein